MKKKHLFLISIAVLVALLFVGCSDREQEGPEQPPAPAGITVYFDTQIKGYNIQPLFLDGITDKDMPDVPYYAGYVFLGWYYDAAGTKEFNIIDGFTQDTTLYAKWEKRQATIGPDQAAPTETDVGGIEYARKGEEYFVVGYTGGLPEINVPETYGDLPVSGVKDGAFSRSIVRKINLPASVRTVEEGAFAGAAKLQAIGVADNNPSYKSVGGVLYNKEGTKLVCLPPMCVATSYSIPAAVDTIGPFAFHGCVISLYFADDGALKTVTENAFSGFVGDVTLPASVENIEKYAFFGADCDVSFPMNCKVTALRNGAFDGFVGAKLKIPASVTEISGSAFNGCAAEVDLSLTGLTALGDHAFNGYIGKKLFIPASVSSLGKGCFYRCTSEITFDERSDLRSVGEESFSNFGGKVVFPASVRAVGRYAFYHALSGAEIVFSVKANELTVDETAFKSSLATVTYQ